MYERVCPHYGSVPSDLAEDDRSQGRDGSFRHLGPGRAYSEVQHRPRACGDLVRFAIQVMLWLTMGTKKKELAAGRSWSALADDAGLNVDHRPGYVLALSWLPS